MKASLLNYIKDERHDVISYNLGFYPEDIDYLIYMCELAGMKEIKINTSYYNSGKARRAYLASLNKDEDEDDYEDTWWKR